MDDNTAPIELLFQKAEDYGKTSIELLKLNAIDKSADIISTLVAQLAIVLSVSLAVLVLNIGIALWIGTLLGNSYYGFFIVGGFYTLLAIILNLFKSVWIKVPLNNFIISQMMKKK